METYEKRIIIQYFQQSSELLKEIRHYSNAHPHALLPESLAERANRLLADYADWIKVIAEVVGLEEHPDQVKPPYLLP